MKQNKIRLKMFRGVENVRMGLLLPKYFVMSESAKRSRNFKLSQLKDIEDVFNSRVNALDVDNSEGRYLLSGCGDGSFYLHDLYNLSGSPNYTCKVLHKVERVHKYSVDCVQWYPFDNGLFTTSSMDKTIKVWDTNRMLPADVIKFKEQIFQHHMSKVPSKSSIIAVATADYRVFLIELNSGLCLHQLSGHSKAVLTCKWSPRDEYILATGGCDSKVMFWDVRSAKSCLRVLDQHNGKSRSSDQVTNTAHDGFVNGLCFTECGNYLISFGTDSRLRLWSMYDGRNLMVNYGSVVNDTKKSVQMGISVNAEPTVLYVPSEGKILVYEMKTGNLVSTLYGHYDTATCCYYHPSNLELYSGGHDQQVLMWADESSHCVDNQSKKEVASTHVRVGPGDWLHLTEDMWSSDENDDEN